MQKTLLIIKPDAVARGMIGEITSRLERKGLKLIGCKMMTLNAAVLREHYSHLTDKPFYPGISAFMSRLPVLIQCWSGPEAAKLVRDLTGSTNGRLAAVGTIRGDLAISIQSNLVHASDGEEAAQVEIDRFFAQGELCDYTHPLEDILLSPDEVR